MGLMRSPGIFENEKYMLLHIVLIVAIVIVSAVFMPGLIKSNSKLLQVLVRIVPLIVMVIGLLFCVFNILLIIRRGRKKQSEGDDG